MNEMEHRHATHAPSCTNYNSHIKGRGENTAHVKHLPNTSAIIYKFHTGPVMSNAISVSKYISQKSQRQTHFIWTKHKNLPHCKMFKYRKVLFSVKNVQSYISN